MHKFVLTPEKEDFEIYCEVWDELDKNPDIDEDKLINSIASNRNKQIKEIDDILVKVKSYKEVKQEDCLEELTNRIKKSKIHVKNVKHEDITDSIFIDLKTSFNMNSLIQSEVNSNSVKMDLLNIVDLVFDIMPFARTVAITLLFSGLSSTLFEDSYRNLGTIEFNQRTFNLLKLKEKNLFEIFS